jgi:TolB-like protein/Tfp pilus assembly protein PilF
MPTPTLLQRLKERKLVQWALAYLAGVFVVFQAVEVMAEPWGISPALQRAVHIALVFGLFITLVLAWYHGEKGRQRVSGPELLMVAGLLVVAGVALSMVQGAEEALEPLELVGRPPMNDDGPSIAVLPLENFSPDPADAYFADGMQEQLVAMLARIDGLSVRGRTSVKRYREHPKSLPEIAQELGVSFVIEGSVRMAGGQVSFTAQLMDAVRDEHLWAKEYDRDFSADEIVSIHREIAEHVVAEVQAALTPEDEVRLATEPTASTEAYREYMKGRFHWRTRTAQGLETAVEHFQRAIGLDSSYALAHAGLADCYAVIPYYSGEVDPREMYRLGEAAAKEAIRLYPDLAATHASLGFLKYVSQRDWRGAEESLRYAISLDPTYAQAHHWLADVLMYAGRIEEAIAEGERALEFDPLEFSHNHSQASRLYWGRDFEAAIAQYQRTIDLYPHLFMGWAGLAQALLKTGDLEGALRSRSKSDELYGIDPALSERFLGMAADFHRTGTPGRLPLAFDTVSGFPPSWRATAAMWVGDTSKALDWLERAASENWPDIPGLRNWPLWDPLQNHPRFQALLEQYQDDVER